MRALAALTAEKTLVCQRRDHLAFGEVDRLGIDVVLGGGDRRKGQRGEQGERQA